MTVYCFLIPECIWHCYKVREDHSRVKNSIIRSVFLFTVKLFLLLQVCLFFDIPVKEHFRTWMFLRKPKDCIHGSITTWITLETRTCSIYKPNYPEKKPNQNPTYLQEHNCISWGILNLSRIIRLNKKDGAASLLKYREDTLHSTSSHPQKDQSK